MADKSIQRDGFNVSLRSETVGSLIRQVPTVDPATTLSRVGDLFERSEELWSLPVLHEGRPVGLVRRYSVMKILANRYGRDLHGRSPISEFMDNFPLVIERDVPVETLSRIITDASKMGGGDCFIITENGSYLGIGTIMDLLRKITELQIRNARYANPLTLLPGNVPIQEKIEQLLGEGCGFAACYCDLDSFKAYNDFYGYSRGDAVIRLLAGLIVRFAEEGRDFVGHIGGDDFIVLFRSGNWRERCEGILERFASEVPELYDPPERAAGGIWANDRRGIPVFHPLVSLSIGAVEICGSALSHHDVAAMAAEAKKEAKKTSGSSLFVERRKHEEERKSTTGQIPG